jgi:ferrous iron transport protein A
MNLSNLRAGEHARIVSITTEGAYRRRLLAMGLLPGTVFHILRVAPLGDPVELRVRGSLISLRKQEAVTVNVEKL